MTQSRRALFLFMICPLTGCANRVLVVDPSGRPIQGAAVEPVSRSINGNAVLSDAQGNAEVPSQLGLEETRWVAVFKPGFEAQQVNVPRKWPLKVVLEPAKVQCP